MITCVGLCIGLCISMCLHTCIPVFAPMSDFVEINSQCSYKVLVGPFMKIPLSLSTLSMLVLNSRDWSEIVWLPEISRFKINLAISFIRKKPAGMHWLGYNDAVSSLNEAKIRIFQTYS